MRLATVRTQEGTRAVLADGDGYVDLGVADVGTLLAEPDWAERAASADGHAVRYSTADVELAPLVLTPGKVVCVGLNYRTHILEMGRDLPEHPTLFAKFADALVGANDDIALPPNRMRWIGKPNWSW